MLKGFTKGHIKGNIGKKSIKDAVAPDIEIEE